MSEHGTGNVHAAELAKFGEQAWQWWDTEGVFRTLHAINPLRADYIAARAPLAGARVLDVGCGGGILAEALAARGASVLGIDLAEDNVTVAQEHGSATGLSVEYRVASAETIATEQAAAFDVVTCLEVLEHVPDPVALVRDCARALRPGGHAFFSTINRNAKSFLLAVVGAEYVLGLVPRGTHEYLKLIRPAELARACRAAGLEVRELTGLHFNPLTQTYRLGGNVDVNYFLHATKPRPA
jgi:2-polyprenyl-6-hydroxyphenyl methylase/3-demethylubiquinone-9 3-methyltransferase